MINKPLYKYGLKSNYKIVLIFIFIITIYAAMIVGMYDKESLDLLEGFTKTMPEIMAMFGMHTQSNSLMSFLVTYLYGFLYLLIPLIVTIIVSNKLVAAYVDNGSMAYLLASQNSRKTIIITQIKVLGTIIFTLITFATLFTLISSELMYPGELLLNQFLFLNINLLIFHLFIGSICFLASTIANETKYSLMFGAGIPLISYLIQMLVNIGGKLENLKYITVFSLFQPFEIINKTNNTYIMMLIMIIITIFLYTLSVKIFEKKDISV